MAFRQHAKIPAYAKIDGTALTSSYQSIVSFVDDVFLLYVFCTCNQPVVISLDGGVTDQFELCQESVTIDVRANDVGLANPNIQAKALSAVPTSGNIRITAIRNSAGGS